MICRCVCPQILLCRKDPPVWAIYASPRLRCLRLLSLMLDPTIGKILFRRAHSPVLFVSRWLEAVLRFQLTLVRLDSISSLLSGCALFWSPETRNN